MCFIKINLLYYLTIKIILIIQNRNGLKGLNVPFNKFVYLEIKTRNQKALCGSRDNSTKGNI